MHVSVAAAGLPVKSVGKFNISVLRVLKYLAGF